MKSILCIFFLLILTVSYSQTWQDYSDSCVKYISLDLNKAEKYIELSTKLIKNYNPELNMDYVNYLYRKGAVYSLRYNDKQAEIYLLEAQKKISKLDHDNYFLSAQINYFLATSQMYQDLYQQSIPNFKNALNDLSKSELKNNYILENASKFLSEIYFSRIQNCDSAKVYSELALTYQLNKNDTSQYYNLGIYDLYHRICYCNNDSVSVKMAEYNLLAASYLVKNSYKDSLFFLIKISKSAEIYKKLGQVDKAINIYLNADKLIPNKDNYIYGYYILASLARIYNEKKDYEKAIYYSEKFLKNTIDYLGGNSKNSITAYSILALDYWNNKNYKLAVKNYLKAIELGKENSDISNSQISNWYSNLSSLYDIPFLNDNVKANKYLNLSKEYNEQLNSNKDGEFFFSEGDLFLRNEEYSKAKISFDKAEILLLKEKKYEYLLSLYFQNMSLAYSNRVYEPSQLIYFKNKIAEIEPYLNSETKHLVSLAYACAYMSELKHLEAESILEKNIDFFKEEDTFSYLSVHSTLSQVKISLGKIEEAFTLIDFCIDFLNKKNKVNNPEVLNYYEVAAKIATIYRPEIAMKYITPASVIIDSNDLERSLINANLMVLKGWALSNQNNMSQAIKHFKKAENIFDQFDKFPDYTYVIMLYQKLAGIYILEGDFIAGERYIQKSEKILEKYSDTNSFVYADLYGIKGALYFYKKEYDGALKYFQLSKSIFKANGISQFSGNVDLMYLMTQYISGINTENVKREISLVLEDSNMVVSKMIKQLAGAFLQKVFFIEGDLAQSRKQLFANLKKHREYLESSFKLMSDVEKEKLLSVSKPDFEVLNSQLLFNGEDEEFLRKFMDYRSFYRSLLLSNSNKNFENLLEDDKTRIFLRS